MSSSVLAAEEKKAKEEEAKIMKVIKSLQKFFSKELLWTLLVMLISIPIALICSYIISVYANEAFIEALEILSGVYPTFTAIYIGCVVGLYFARIVMNAIKTQLSTIKKDVKNAG